MVIRVQFRRSRDLVYEVESELNDRIDELGDAAKMAGIVGRLRKPGFIETCNTALAKRPPTGAGWVRKVKIYTRRETTGA
jgi:hypothetical protein